MSADARVWMADEGGWFWSGRHDGPCLYGDGAHTEDSLLDLIRDIEACMGHGLRWVPELHENRGIVLSGWEV